MPVEGDRHNNNDYLLSVRKTPRFRTRLAAARFIYNGYRLSGGAAHLILEGLVPAALLLPKELNGSQLFAIGSLAAFGGVSAVVSEIFHKNYMELITPLRDKLRTEEHLINK